MFPHYKVDEQPNKSRRKSYFPRRRESDDQNAVAFVKKCFTIGVVYHKTQMHRFLKVESLGRETRCRKSWKHSKRTIHEVYTTSSEYPGKERTIVGKNKEIGAPWECVTGDSLDFGSSGFGKFGISGVHDFIGVSVFVLLLWCVHVCCYHYSMVFVRVVLLVWSVCCSY